MSFVLARTRSGGNEKKVENLLAGQRRGTGQEDSVTKRAIQIKVHIKNKTKFMIFWEKRRKEKREAREDYR